MKSVLRRLYYDYLMPSQFAAYGGLIDAANRAGYCHISVRQYHDTLSRSLPMPDKLIVHRHDIDTDLRTTRKLFEINKKYGVKSSFYFRLSTLDIDLMHEIEEYGSEASYHYEELATYAKKHRIKDVAVLRDHLPRIRDEFYANFCAIEGRLRKKMQTVASHGDFANRKLKLSNTEILADQQLRQRCGIEVEAYDRILMENIDIYIADRPARQSYYPMNPLEALDRHRRIYLLTHPRQMESNWQANTKENLCRVYEAVTW